MSRLQLALNVADLDAAIGFYSTLFRTEPHKVRPGYANFAISEPPLKLVLFEGEGPGGTINHLGIEVGSVDEVRQAVDRLDAAGVATDVRASELCCHAVQDKVWVEDADGARWEVYAVTDDAPKELPLAAAACC